MHFTTTSLLTTTALLPLISATAIPSYFQKRGGCQLTSSGSGSKVITDETICKPQGEGAWTFAMQTSLTSTGLPTCAGTDCDASSTFDNVSGASGFFILDNTCTVRGGYTKNTCDNDDGIPYTIMENFLPKVLTIEHIDLDVGKPYFQFKYGNGEFTTGNNHCGCGTVDESLNSVTKACKCAFMVDGEESNVA